MKKVKNLLTLWELNLLNLQPKKQIMLKKHFLLLEMKLKIEYRNQMMGKKKIKQQNKSYLKVKIYKTMDVSAENLCKIILVYYSIN